jgi:DHA1 family tetracycline resistance protein-like MFS transporter
MTERKPNLALIFILLTVTLDAIGIGIIFPVMPDLMVDVTHEGLAKAALWGGVITASFAVMQFVFGPIVGNLSDRFGRRPVLLVSLIVVGLDYVVMGLTHSVWVLLIARMVAGIASATHSTANAFIADISAPDERAKRFGLMGAGFGIGFVAGPIIGGVVGAVDPRAPFFMAACLAAANLVFGYFVMPESLVPQKRRPFTLARSNPLASLAAIRGLPGLNILLTVSFLYAVTFNVWPAIWGYFGKEVYGWNATWIGISLATFGICMAVVQGAFVGPVIRRLGESRTVTLGFGIETASYSFLAFNTSGALALASTPISAMGGITGPALQALASRATPENQQGELQGIMTSINALAMIVAPLVMTWVFGYFSAEGAPVYFPGAPFLLSAVVMVAAVILFVAGPRAKVAGTAEPQ